MLDLENGHQVEVVVPEGLAAGDTFNMSFG